MDFKSKKMKKYYYSMFVGVGTFLGVVIIVLAAIIPLYGKASDMTQTSKIKKVELQKLLDKKKILEEKQKEEDKLKEYAKTLSIALPDNKDVGRLFIQVEELVKNSNGAIKGIGGDSGSATSGSTAISNVKKYTYTLPIEFQDYFGLKSFLTNSKSALRLIEIENVRVTGNELGKINASISLVTYARN